MTLSLLNLATNDAKLPTSWQLRINPPSRQRPELPNGRRTLRCFLVLGWLGCAWALPGVALAETTPPAAREAVPAAPEAAAPPASVPPRKPLPGDLQRAEALADALPAVDPHTRIHWFEGNSETRYLGLYRAAVSPQVKGHVLILHDNRQHPDWPGIIQPLRNELPTQGWNTLSLALPDYWPPEQIPPRSAATDASESTEPDQSSQPSTKPVTATKASADSKTPPPTQNAAPQNAASAPADAAAPTEPTPIAWRQRDVEVAPEDYAQSFAARVQQAVTYLQTQANLPLVAVAVGESASWLVQQLAASPGSVQGLVIIHLAEPPHTDTDLAKALPQLSLPILDLAPRYAARHDPMLRQAWMQQAGRQDYELRSWPVNAAQLSSLDHAVVRAVRGWMTRQLQQ